MTELRVCLAAMPWQSLDCPSLRLRDRVRVDVESCFEIGVAEESLSGLD